MVLKVIFVELRNGVVAGDGAKDITRDGSGAITVAAVVDGGDDGVLKRV